MRASPEETRLFPVAELQPQPTAKEILRRVYEALEEKGYRAVDQIVGYLVSGDPAYITSHKEARLWIRKVERDELLEEIVRFYLENA
ncbi:MAG: IreB family regulatory phosphoprotein [Clostridia bacterium]|nr:IreB family regulatory phosphoprotein [Bacillota bacterium]MBO2521063.1 IreB family regulatory phosphoprotein [Bacillota bacterium]